MSIYLLTEEHELFAQSVRKWVEQQLQPHVDSMEETRKIPSTILQSLQSLGFLNLQLDEQTEALNCTWHVLLLQEIAKAGAVGFAQVIKHHTSLALPILNKYFQTSQSLNEQMFCTYVQVTNTKCEPFVVNGQVAKYVVVHNIENYTLTLYVRDQLHFHRKPDLVGWHSGQIAFLQQANEEVGHLQLSKEESLYWQALHHLYDAAIFYGLATTIQKQSSQYAQTRIQFDGPLTQFQVIRHALVDQAIMIEKIKHLLYVTAFNEQTSHFIQQCFSLHITVRETIFTIADSNVQIHGGNGFMMEFPAQRYWRDCQLYRVVSEEISFSYAQIGQTLLNTPQMSL